MKEKIIQFLENFTGGSPKLHWDVVLEENNPRESELFFHAWFQKAFKKIGLLKQIKNDCEEFIRKIHRDGVKTDYATRENKILLREWIRGHFLGKSDSQSNEVTEPEVFPELNAVIPELLTKTLFVGNFLTKEEQKKRLKDFIIGGFLSFVLTFWVEKENLFEEECKIFDFVRTHVPSYWWYNCTPDPLKKEELQDTNIKLVESRETSEVYTVKLQRKTSVKLFENGTVREDKDTLTPIKLKSKSLPDFFNDIQSLQEELKSSKGQSKSLGRKNH